MSNLSASGPWWSIVSVSADTRSFSSNRAHQMTTSHPEDLWTDIYPTEDEFPDEEAWPDWPGGRRHAKINMAALAAALAIPAGAAAITTIGVMHAQPAYASSGGGTTAS